MTTIKRILAAIRRRAIAIHDWCAEPPSRSWYAHMLASYTVTVAFGWLLGKALGNVLLGLFIVSNVPLVGYTVKEIGNALGYWKDDKLDEVHMGATRRADGWGDWLGPLTVWLMALMAWLLAG